MPSEKCRIAAAGQHSAPNSSLVKTARPFWTAHTGIALDLVATQIFARRFAAIQPVVRKRNSFRTDECVQLWIVGESIFLRWIGELNCGDISGNAQKLQPPVNSTCLISAIQSKPTHWDTKIDLPFQMPQDQKGFPSHWQNIHQRLLKCRVCSPQLLPSDTRCRVCCRD